MPGEPGMDQNELFVQPAVETNDPQSLGAFNTPMTLDWTADGKSLILTVDFPQAPQIITVKIADGTVEKLADGTGPAMRP